LSASRRLRDFVAGIRARIAMRGRYPHSTLNSAPATPLPALRYIHSAGYTMTGHAR
jgi:hypothetical protein